tara:strand:- start:608 stop:919 length:312 start_codon:yes stop_codon:yes gene_type:complete
MKNFKNIDWKFHPLDKKSIQGVIEFNNGLLLSVVAGAKFYSSKIGDAAPHHSKFASFEVAVLNKDGDFITQKFTGEDNEVWGWQSREDIDSLILQIEDYQTVA